LSKEEKSNPIVDFFSGFDKSTQLAYIISRFYYQILGIYFPAVVLIIFFYVYGDYLSAFYNPLKIALKDVNNSYLTILTFIGIMVITGELINVVTSRISFLSPGPVRIVDKLRKLMGQNVTPAWLYQVKWPTWFGIADYPISFSSFDRYYLESLDKEKRSLAGKIGWTTFFRNMCAVFSVIFVTQVLTKVYSILTPISNAPALSSPPVFPTNLSELTPLVITFVVSLIFYLGYRANRRSYDLVFWKSYRRNEFIKWFETRVGSLQTIFQINTSNLTQAIDFATDALYISSDRYLQDFASIILTKFEEAYRTTFMLHDNHSNYDVKCDYHKNYPSDKDPPEFSLECGSCQAQISDIIENNKIVMNYCYKFWRDGSHELVLEKCFDGLKELNRILQDNSILGLEYWQKIRGFLLLAENMHIRHSLAEIRENLTKWDWINKSTDSTNKSTGNESLSGVYYKMNENIDLTYDKWYRTLSRIQNFVRNQSISKGAVTEVFKQFEKSNVLKDFGGYQYERSIQDLESLESELKKLDCSFSGISFTFEKTWKMIPNGISAFKIVPIQLSENGIIDFRILNNTKNIRTLSKFLYGENKSKIGNIINFNEIISKEIVIMDSLGSLIIFSYRNGNAEMICHQILCCSENKEKMYFVKYEEEKEKKSSVQIFEAFVESLRAGRQGSPV